MSFLNDDDDNHREFELPTENRQKFLQELIGAVLEDLAEDSHLKLISIKNKKIKEPKFLKKAIPLKKLTTIFEHEFEIDKLTGICQVSLEKIKKAREMMVAECKNNIFSILSDEGIMALFFNEKSGKIYWAFPDENKQIPDEKEILKRRK